MYISQSFALILFSLIDDELLEKRIRLYFHFYLLYLAIVGAQYTYDSVKCFMCQVKSLAFFSYRKKETIFSISVSPNIICM
jgi:hypothetical protein